MTMKTFQKTTPREQTALLLDFENLVLGLENNSSETERAFSIADTIAFLEKHYGPVVYRKAFADWSNPLFRKYAPDMMSCGVEMQHLIKVGYGNKSVNDSFLILEAMDCVIHYPEIRTFVLGTGDADYLPLVSKLKASGRNVVGLGASGTISNILIQNCNEYIFASKDELQIRSKGAVDKTTVVNTLHRILGSGSMLLSTLGNALKESLPDFTPSSMDCPDLSTFLRSIPEHIHFLDTEEGVPSRVEWVDDAVTAAMTFPEYMRATRGFVEDPQAREDILHDIYTVVCDSQRSISNRDLRQKIDPDRVLSDKAWYGTIFSLIYGNALWEPPESADKPQSYRRICLHRDCQDEDDFRMRYYSSLFHKASIEREDFDAKSIANLLFAEDPDANLPFCEQIADVIYSQRTP